MMPPHLVQQAVSIIADLGDESPAGIEPEQQSECVVFNKLKLASQIVYSTGDIVRYSGTIYEIQKFMRIRCHDFGISFRLTKATRQPCQHFNMYIRENIADQTILDMHNATLSKPLVVCHKCDSNVDIIDLQPQ